MMNRTFHSRIHAQNWLLLACLLFLTGYAAWQRHALFFGMGLLMMVVLIKQMIHTVYVLSDDVLTVHTSRFRRDLVIPLQRICRIEQASRRLFGWELPARMLIVYTTEAGAVRYAAVAPQHPDEFVDCLRKRREKRLTKTTNA